jgi:hypothetical protein
MPPLRAGCGERPAIESARRRVWLGVRTAQRACRGESPAAGQAVATPQVQPTVAVDRVRLPVGGAHSQVVDVGLHSGHDGVELTDEPGEGVELVGQDG